MLVKDAWYAGCRTGEIEEGPIGRTILGLPMVFFRPDPGQAAALLDACPHRGVPLSDGTITNGRIKCPYHGIEFDAAGVCRFNPHIEGPPDRIKQRSFPVVERYGMIWVWPGNPAAADPGAIPDYSWFATPEKFTAGGGYTHVAADYRLIVDNLLDLSHGEFLHPQTVGTPGASEVVREKVWREGDAVHYLNLIPDMPPSRMFGAWSKSERVDQSAEMIWHPVSNLLLDLSIYPPGTDPSQGWRLPSAHILTPEDENNTHYFWAFARDFALGDDALTAQIVAGGDLAFRTEDKPVIEAAQRRLKETGISLLNFSKGDSASAMARAALKKLASREMANANAEHQAA